MAFIPGTPQFLAPDLGKAEGSLTQRFVCWSSRSRTSMYVCMHVCINIEASLLGGNILYIHIYIYTERERERSLLGGNFLQRHWQLAGLCRCCRPCSYCQARVHIWCTSRLRLFSRDVEVCMISICLMLACSPDPLPLYISLKTQSEPFWAP